MARPKSATVDLKVRMKEPLRAKIEAAAKDRGVSLNAETVDRLEQSFRDEDALGGAETSAVLKLMAAGAIIVQQRTGKSWTEDWDTFVAVQKCWKTLVTAARPDPPRTVRAAVEDKMPKFPEPLKPPRITGAGLGRGLLLEPVPTPSDEERQAHEKKMVRYRQRQQAVSERIKTFVGLGEEVADLFPKRRKTKG